MKKAFLLIPAFIILIFLGCSCNQQPKAIVFNPLTDKDFNSAADSSYSVPHGKAWDEKMKMHDSCMGYAFPVNAMFIRTKDSFRLGDILNRQTMKVVKQWDMSHITASNFSQIFHIVTKPCFERRPGNVSVRAFFNKETVLHLANADNNINSELNDIIHNSVSQGVEIGSWFNAELTDGLGKILDTTKDEVQLAYKHALLDTNNIILVRSASLTNITFYISANKPVSRHLQAILAQKPFAVVENSSFGAQLFFIDENTFQVTFSGIFQVMGQFMKCSEQ